MPLNLQANIENPDGFYQKLIEMQRDLSDDEVQLTTAKLVLILANHIGDEEILDEAMAAAKA